MKKTCTKCGIEKNTSEYDRQYRTDNLSKGAKLNYTYKHPRIKLEGEK